MERSRRTTTKRPTLVESFVQHPLQRRNATLCFAMHFLLNTLYFYTLRPPSGHRLAVLPPNTTVLARSFIILNPFLIALFRTVCVHHQWWFSKNLKNSQKFSKNLATISTFKKWLNLWKIVGTLDRTAIRFSSFPTVFNDNPAISDASFAKCHLTHCRPIRLHSRELSTPVLPKNRYIPNTTN